MAILKLLTFFSNAIPFEFVCLVDLDAVPVFCDPPEVGHQQMNFEKSHAISLIFWITCSHMHTHGQRGVFPPLRVQNPPPTLRPKMRLPSKKIFDTSPPLKQKIRNFWQSFTKNCPNGAKRRNIFCVVLNCGENVLLSPLPSPPLWLQSLPLP